MAKQRAFVALALGACLLGLAGHGPSFVTPGASGAAARSAVRRTQMHAVLDASGLIPAGPVMAYSDALAVAATKKGESVPVTKDVMKVKGLFDDNQFKDELQFIVNNPTLEQTEKAASMIELMQPLESSVVPTFVTFLAKKRRLKALKSVTEAYMSTLYRTQNIVPVRVMSAQPLSEEQKEAIKAKMKAKTGASDIKLVCKIEPTLVAGLTVEYGFEDADQLETPTDGMDLSMKTYLEKAALDQGVVASV